MFYNKRILKPVFLKVSRFQWPIIIRKKDASRIYFSKIGSLWIKVNVFRSQNHNERSSDSKAQCSFLHLWGSMLDQCGCVREKESVRVRVCICVCVDTRGCGWERERMRGENNDPIINEKRSSMCNFNKHQRMWQSKLILWSRPGHKSWWATEWLTSNQVDAITEN